MSDELSKNLKQAREKKGLSQKELSEAIGVAKSTYSLYESGKRKPSIPIIQRLSNYLSISGDELLGTTQSNKYIRANLSKDTVQKLKSKNFETAGNIEPISLEKFTTSLENMASFLEDIYSHAEHKVYTFEDTDGNHISFSYYLIGTGTNQFALSLDDMDELTVYIKSSLPFLVSKMKGTKSVDDFIEEQIERIQGQISIDDDWKMDL